jgi:hypothetical protein|nr:MAG TPA: hypothetical protein [Caudoviricetes sp.]
MDFEKQFNNIQIYFGKVVDIKDDLHQNRIKCTIEDYTDKISTDDLPWYYPFFGQNYLPTVGDIVPVIIMNQNFAQGFYNPKIDLLSRTDNKSISDGEEYEQYVELYDKLGIQATYKKEKGWEFKNQNTFVQLETEKISLKTPKEQIIITDDKIDIGNDGPAMPLGDKTVESFEKHLKDVMQRYDEIMQLFLVIQEASTNPFTLPIKIALTPKLAVANVKFKPSEIELQQFHKTIQSKKVFIE